MHLPRRLHVPAPEVARDIDLRAWRAAFPEATPIADLQPRTQGTVVGVVRRLMTDPSGRLEVTVEDGSGSLTAVFTGRTSLPGLEFGGALRLAGTVAVEGHGERLMRNPAWEHVTAPYERPGAQP